MSAEITEKLCRKVLRDFPQANTDVVALLEEKAAIHTAPELCCLWAFRESLKSSGIDDLTQVQDWEWLVNLPDSHFEPLLAWK